MSEPNLHDRTASALVEALRANLSPAWAVLAGARWQPLADFPNDCYAFDALIVSVDAALDWNEPAQCFGPGLQPITVFDVIRKEGCEAEFYDKPDALCSAGVCEYCLWDPSAERMRPAFQAFRRRESVLRLVKLSLHGVFFSAAGIRTNIGDGAVEITPCGEPRVEEELFTCEGLLNAALERATRDRAAITALSAKVERLRAELGGSRS